MVHNIVLTIYAEIYKIIQASILIYIMMYIREKIYTNLQKIYSQEKLPIQSLRL